MTPSAEVSSREKSWRNVELTPKGAAPPAGADRGHVSNGRDNTRRGSRYGDLGGEI